MRELIPSFEGRTHGMSKCEEPYNFSGSALNTKTSEANNGEIKAAFTLEDGLIQTISINFTKLAHTRGFSVSFINAAVVSLTLTGKFSFCCSAAFFFHSRSRSSFIRLSMATTSRLRLFRFSLCCCNLEFWSWLSLFLN